MSSNRPTPVLLQSTGTHGIGKSMMSLFILILAAGGHFKYVQRNKVLYQRPEGCYFLDFSGTTPIISEGTYDELRYGALLRQYVCSLHAIY